MLIFYSKFCLPAADESSFESLFLWFKGLVWISWCTGCMRYFFIVSTPTVVGDWRTPSKERQTGIPAGWGMYCCGHEQQQKFILAPEVSPQKKINTSVKCTTYLEYFHSLTLPSDSLFRQGAEAIISLSSKPPDSFDKESNFTSQFVGVSGLLLRPSVSLFSHVSSAIPNYLFF